MCFLPLLEGGNAVRFFILCFLCLVLCLCRFFYRSSFLRVAVRNFFRERTFVFWVLVLVVCFFSCCFAYVFALLFGFSLPKMSRKNSLDVRSGVSWFFFSLPLVSSPTSSPFLFLFFLREKA